MPSSDKFNIYLVWLGHSFPLIYQKSFETVVKFHPNAEIMIFSNELKEEWFSALNKSGNIFVVRYNLTQLVKGQKGWNFVQKAVRILNGEQMKNLQVSNVHLSDFLRLYLIYTFGGLYLDTDMIVLRDLSIYKNHIGVDDNKSYICSYNVYSTESAKNFSCLCNCLLSFEKKHPFIGKALDLYESYWSKYQGYSPGGALMLIDIVKDYLKLVHFMPNYYWICNKHIDKRFDVVFRNDSNIQDAMKSCYVIHLYGAGQGSMSVDNFEQKFAGRVWNAIFFE
ncbi:glycosyltransferase CAZy family GT32 [Brachionus plicatilis]|uniref:Glycosyltransferase CAZy family GT32 n=1 Tax=Brachionus plicatilis TaxID=10195 RepID=A0A3M7R7M5_BRAPC|nr:glycosyltransferase CAZy family GT32 [Brachionus plicatilis]